MPSNRTLISFDVFDTLLTRAVGSPSSLFLLLGRLPSVQAVSGCTPEEFARLRIEAERRARRGLGEVTLQQVHAELAAGLALDQQQSKELIEAELALERRLSRVVPGARRLLDATPASRRVAVSDMYLPAAVVEELLDRQELRDRLDHVYVSSDFGLRKGTGQLFDAVRRAEEISPRHWRHIGDDAWSDDRVPRLLAIQTSPAASARLNRYEQIWESHRWQTSGLSSLFAGASRLARLHSAPSSEEATVVRVAAGVAAPILTAYVLWVLNAAVGEGLRRLYFLARDGEILFQIACRLRDRLGIDIELRYLHGSRYAFRRAAADSPLATAEWLWREARGLTNGELLRWLGVNQTVAAETLQRHGLAADERSPNVQAVLESDEAFMAEARAASVAARQATQSYLGEQGLTDGTPFAIVDTGWSGRLLQSLHQLLEPMGSGVGRAFFMAYHHDESGGGFHRPEAISGYLFDERLATGFLETRKPLWWLVEMFCVADHASTVGFVLSDDRTRETRPLLAGDSNPLLGGWRRWHRYRDTVYAFVEQCVWDADIANTRADLRPAVVAALSAFWFQPDADEAAEWGRFPFEQDPVAGRPRELARPIRLREFGNRLRGQDNGLVWSQASLRLTAPGLRPFAGAGLRAAEWTTRRRRGQPLLPRHWRERLAVAVSAMRLRAASASSAAGHDH